MKAHVIENGKVVNTIEVNSLDFMPNLVEANEGGIGWLYADGVFTDPSAPTQEELSSFEAVTVRAQRNAKLTNTDWTQVADAQVDKAVWATYRQALRDIPAQAGFPWDVNWPEMPE